MATKTCRVMSITKEEMKWCGSRAIKAELQDAEGKNHNINWVRTPSVLSTRNFKVNSSKKPAAFSLAWDFIEVGDTVELIEGNGDEGEYFVPAD